MPTIHQQIYIVIYRTGERGGHLKLSAKSKENYLFINLFVINHVNFDGTLYF